MALVAEFTRCDALSGLKRGCAGSPRASLRLPWAELSRPFRAIERILKHALRVLPCGVNEATGRCFFGARRQTVLARRPVLCLRSRDGAGNFKTGERRCGMGVSPMMLKRCLSKRSLPLRSRCPCHADTGASPEIGRRFGKSYQERGKNGDWLLFSPTPRRSEGQSLRKKLPVPGFPAPDFGRYATGMRGPSMHTLSGRRQGGWRTSLSH